MIKCVLRIHCGALLAFAAIWAVTAFLMNSIVEREYDGELKTKVPKPGSVVQFRTEGWADTHYGRHGLPGVPSIGDVKGPKVIIWGDSHIEALQVEDRDKVAMQVNRLWLQAHPDDPITALNIGESGVHLAQHYFDIDHYEKLITDVKRHYFVLNFTGRATPSPVYTRVPTLYAQFVEDKEGYGLLARDETDRDRMKKIFPLLNAWRLRVVYFVASKMRRGSFNLDFRVGPRKAKAKAIAPETVSKRASDFEAFCWLLSAFKEKTATPITILYAPVAPSIYKGKIGFDIEPEEAQRVERLRLACETSGVGFIHLGQSFCRSYKETGRFPRGFFNTPPAEGHYNVEGHRLVAEAIVKDLESNKP